MTEPRKIPLVNPANLLTSTRLLILPVVVWAMATHRIALATWCIIYSGVVDAFDGTVARKCNCASPTGEMLDAISDAALFLVTMLAAAAYGYAHTLDVTLFLIMGVINALGRVIFIKRTGTVTNFRSYASEVLGGVSFYVLAAIILDYYTDPSLRILTLTGTIIVVHDYWRILTYPITPEEPA